MTAIHISDKIEVTALWLAMVREEILFGDYSGALDSLNDKLDEIGKAKE